MMKKMGTFIFVFLMLSLVVGCSKKVEYTVNFDSKGGTVVNPIFVQSGKTLPFIQASKEGYTFDGWYKSLDKGVTFDEKWVFETNLVTHDTTLYAKWIINQYTLTFDSDGGTHIPAITLDYRSNFVTNEPVKPGYTFIGWNPALPERIPSENLTLVAQWQINQYTLFFDSTGGTEVSSITEDFLTPLLAPVAPLKEGHSFIGWYTTAQLMTSYTFTTMPATNLTLYAKWQINQYTLTFDTKGGTPLSSITQNYDTLIHPPIEPLQEGYTFSGWFIDALYKTPYVFNKMPAQNLTFYALWHNTISFNSRGGTLVDAITLLAGKDVEEPEEPMLAASLFMGWYLDEDLTEKYTFTVMPSQNITLYAKWKSMDNLITYHLDGGINHLSNPDKYDSETPTILLSIPSKIGYTFDGWFYHPNFDGDIVVEISTNKAIDIDLFAKWSINQYHIFYTIITDQYNINHHILLDHDDTIIQVSLDANHSAILTSKGRLFTFGYNQFGQLGDGTTTDKTTPTEITQRFNLHEEETLIHVSIGESHSSALTSKGRLFTWGYNNLGQLGDQTTQSKSTPIEITQFFNLHTNEILISVSLGEFHSAALSSTGRVFTWGYNNIGQLGDGTQMSRNTPTDITSRFDLYSNEKIISVSLGEFHSAVLTSAGRVFTWGYNQRGQLGDGTIVNRNIPVDITAHFSLSVDEKIIEVSLGETHSSAITSEGRLFVWGLNASRQLGDGTTTNSSIPIDITSRFNLYTHERIFKASLGGVHSAALTSTGRLFTWGGNMFGQLGDGTTTSRNVQTNITSLFNLDENETIINVSLGELYSSAITSNGRIFTWGYNALGSLGDGTTNQKNVPTEIPFYQPTLLFQQVYSYEDEINPFIPSLTGYVFSGWFIDAYMAISYTFSTMPAKNVKLYGYWIGE